MNDWCDPRRRYPDRPHVDDESDAVLVEAINDMVLLRSPMWHGDAGAVLHALGSLAAQIEEWLPDAIAEARDQDYSFAEIARLVGLRTPKVKRYAQQAAPRKTPLD